MDGKRPRRMHKIGDTVRGRYSILGYLGRGGQRRVYRALDGKGPPGKRTVVIKEMFRRKKFDREMANIELFNQEVRLFQSLSHPNIAPILDYFVEGGSLTIVQEYIEGPTLKEHLEAKGPLEEEEALSVLMQMLSTLEYLHEQVPPVILRDVKPSNTIYRRGQAIVVDMGGARSQSVAQSRYDAMQMSTRGYAAPEKASQETGGEVQDLYSLGVMMHQLVTGWDPLSGNGRPPAVRRVNPEVSPGLARVIEKAIELKPERRYQSAFEMRLAVQELLKARAGRPLPRWVDRVLDAMTVMLTAAVVLLPLGAAATAGEFVPLPHPTLTVAAGATAFWSLFLLAVRHHKLPGRWIRALSRRLHQSRRRIRGVALASNALLLLLTLLMFRV